MVPGSCHPHDDLALVERPHVAHVGELLLELVPLLLAKRREVGDARAEVANGDHGLDDVRIGRLVEARQFRKQLAGGEVPRNLREVLVLRILQRPRELRVHVGDVRRRRLHLEDPPAVTFRNRRLGDLQPELGPGVAHLLAVEAALERGEGPARRGNAVLVDLVDVPARAAVRDLHHLVVGVDRVPDRELDRRRAVGFDRGIGPALDAAGRQRERGHEQADQHVLHEVVSSSARTSTDRARS